jgi:hypothetical protein
LVTALIIKLTWTRDGGILGRDGIREGEGLERDKLEKEGLKGLSFVLA